MNIRGDAGQVSVAIANLIEKKLGNFLLELSQDVGQEVVQRTPVDTGFLRASWAAQLNEKPADPGSRDYGGNGDAAGATAQNNINLAVAKVKPGDRIFYTNHAKYAAYVEYGTSKMAPRAMVRQTVAMIPELVRRIAARIKK